MSNVQRTNAKLSLARVLATLPSLVNDHPCEDVWANLLDLQERFDGLVAGTEDPGYEELADGRCVPLGLLAAQELALEELEDALDAVVGLGPAGRSYAA